MAMAAEACSSSNPPSAHFLRFHERACASCSTAGALGMRTLKIMHSEFSTENDSMSSGLNKKDELVNKLIEKRIFT